MLGPGREQLPVAEEWWRREVVDDGLTLLYEPAVDPMIRANVWHVVGRDRDLLIDSGLGIASLREAFPDLFQRSVVLVLTHGHLDHMGGAHEFPECWAHALEPVGAPPPGSLHGVELTAELGLQERLPDLLVSAVPHPGYRPERYRLRPATVTRSLCDGDRVELGDRTFEVLHLPGHSPGSIALFDRQGGTLFSGDVVYDGELLDGIVGADVCAYVRSMERLRALPVWRVHAGHGPSFNRRRLLELIDEYVASRRTSSGPGDVCPARPG